MTTIDKISFDLPPHKVLSEIIEKLKSTGACDVYGLPRMHKGKGEVRLALHGPSPKKPKATGVFVQIMPTKNCATVIKRRKLVEGSRRTKLNSSNAEEVFQLIYLWRSQVKDKLKESEKVDPNKPGTLQGGRPESNPKKF